MLLFVLSFNEASGSVIRVALERSKEQLDAGIHRP